MKDEYISGEEYRKIQQNAPTHLPARARQPSLAIIIGFTCTTLVLMVISFFGGIWFQKSQINSQTNGTAGQQMMNGSNDIGAFSPQDTVQCSSTTSAQCTPTGASFQPIIGKVTSFDASSVTITPLGSTTSSTYSIGSSTFVASPNTHAPTAYRPGDIKVGDLIGIIPTKSGSSEVDTILIDLPTNTSGSATLQ